MGDETWQHITIAGEKVDNPVIISLHGGPGSPTSYVDYCWQDYLTDEYTRITTVHDGIVFEWVATLQNGWQAVKIGSQVGWVSGKYSKITTE